MGWVESTVRVVSTEHERFAMDGPHEARVAEWRVRSVGASQRQTFYNGRFTHHALIENTFL